MTGDPRADVLGYLDDHVTDMAEMLCELVRTPSVSGSDEENGIQSALAGRLSGWGLDIDHWAIDLPVTAGSPDFPGMEVDRSEAWGLVGRVPGAAAGRSLMLNSHVDVVPPGDPAAWTAGPFAATARGGDIVGRGACDMKGGLVAAMWAVRALLATGVRLDGDLMLACVQGEEDGGLGTFALTQRGWRADACVIPEPTSLDLVPASAGSLTFRLTVRGLATHASRRSRGVSAIEKFLPIFRGLRDLEAVRNASPDPLMARWDLPYPIEIGRTYAGDWSSSVPDVLVAEGRFGVALGEDVSTAKAAFEEAIAAVCTSDDWLRDHPVDVEWWGGQFASGATPADADIVGAVARAHAAVSSRPQQMWGAPYGSDLRLMRRLGVPTVHYGPGDVSLAHGPDERVPMAEVKTAAQAIALLAIDFCGPTAD